MMSAMPISAFPFSNFISKILIFSFIFLFMSFIAFLIWFFISSLGVRIRLFFKSSILSGVFVLSYFINYVTIKIIVIKFYSTLIY